MVEAGWGGGRCRVHEYHGHEVLVMFVNKMLHIIIHFGLLDPCIQKSQQTARSTRASLSFCTIPPPISTCSLPLHHFVQHDVCELAQSLKRLDVVCRLRIVCFK